MTSQLGPYDLLRYLLLVTFGAGWSGTLQAGERTTTAMTAVCSRNSYFVDAEAGSDSYSGQYAEPILSHADGPCRTIGAAYQKAQPGDCILIKQGVYRETVILSKQASASNPITIRAFPGHEGKAIISGAERVLDWRPCESQVACAGNPHWQNVFYADVDFEVKCLFQGRSVLTPSRFPDSGWCYPTQVSSSNSREVFWDTTLPLAFDSLRGADCHIKTKLWHVDHIPVETYSAESGRVVLASGTRYEMSTSFGYYLTNLVSEINEEGEWAYDRDQRRLYLWPLGQTPEDIEVGFRAYGIDTSQDCAYHVIKSLVVERATVGIRIDEASHVTVRDNTIEHAYEIGILDEGSVASIIRGNVVRYANAEGIADKRSSRDDLIEGNHVYATGAEYPGDDLVNGVGEAIVLKGQRARCINNRVERSSYNGISVAWGDTAGREIAYNYVTESCLSLSDGAGIYTGDDSSSDEWDHYHHNIVTDVWGYLGGWTKLSSRCDEPLASCRGEAHGFYLDERGNHRVFERNTAINCGASGAFFHWTQNSSLVNNTFYGNELCQVLFSGGDDSQTFLRDNYAEGNVLIATDAYQQTFRLELERYDVGFGVSNENAFYHPQSDAHLATCQYGSSGLVCTVYSLDQWRDLTGQEGDSTDQSTDLHHDIDTQTPLILINPRMETLTVDLGASGYVDINHAPVGETLAIAPFESAVLFPHPDAQ